MGKKRFLGAVEVTKKLLNDVIFMCESRMKTTYFTRSGGKLSFKNLILFNLFFVRKSVQLELEEFFEMLKLSDEGLTKQAYSEARQKISPSAFITLSKAVIQWFYDQNDYKTFDGYRLCAIDGSVFEIHNTKQLRDHFGYTQNKTIKYARARVSCIYDIENDLVLTSKIASYKTSERDLAKDTIEELKELGLKNDLILFDRGYPSRDFIAYIEKSDIKYVMRVPMSSMRELKETTQSDQTITFSVDGETLTARVLRFELSSGEEEVLVTNLMDKNLGTYEFKELYFKRWSIEEEYGVMKSKIQIENFTGSTPIAVEQDFYASIYLTNMVALLESEVTERIQKNDEGKELKHEYKANTNLVVGKLKNSLALLLLERNPWKRQRRFKRLIKWLEKKKTPIRPGRSYKRNKVLKSNKFPRNRKRCL